MKSNVAFAVVTVAEGLVRPWGMQFLPDGRMLVTERPGRLRIVTAAGELSPAVEGLPPVDARGQGGLLDVLLARDFATSRMIYWSYAEPRGEGMNNTAVARGKLVDGAAPRVETSRRSTTRAVLSRSPLRRTVWARDGTLFVTQGDRRSRPAACRRRTWTA
jgi:glucose/arabinose dehydrogenase